MSTNPRFSAVLFDLGGVVFPSPFEAFDLYDTRNGLVPGFCRRLIRVSSETGAWAALERGEVTMSEFFVALEAEAADLGVKISASSVMATIGEASGARPAMLKAISVLRKNGLKVGALTNNWAHEGGATTFGGIGEGSLFDAIVESTKVGMRKPDPRIYQLALDRLDAIATETIFLDDLGINLKPAREMGMTTIKVVDHLDALRELSAHLELELQN